jgi:glycine cleavage system H protein
MITGYPSVASAVKAMRLGVSNYVPKPFTPDTLNAALKKALEERETERKDLFHYQNYIWAKLLEDGTVKIGVNHLFRERVGDILYVDLPFNRIKVEQERLCIRILASDKQVHKLYVAIRGRVIRTNNEINFNTDLINKDPFGKGWIVQIEPSHLKEDLKNWSGDTSILDRYSKGGANFHTRISTRDPGLKPQTDLKIKHKPESNLNQRSGQVSHRAKASIPKFFLSVLGSRLFLFALLPVCLGLMAKALFYQVSPKGAN